MTQLFYQRVNEALSQHIPFLSRRFATLEDVSRWIIKQLPSDLSVHGGWLSESLTLDQFGDPNVVARLCLGIVEKAYKPDADVENSRPVFSGIPKSQLHDPEDSTILHDVLKNHLPAYAILAASRAAAQAIADNNAAERRALVSRAACDGPPDLLTPAAFFEVGECIDVNDPTLDVVPAVPLQRGIDFVNLERFAGRLVPVLYVSCVGIVVALFVAFAATAELLAAELTRRA